MTEDEAREWIVTRFGAAATCRVETFLDRVVAENDNQNLISPASIPHIWSRHALDSAQLLPLAPAGWGTWLDIGTGGGFPGMIVALLAPNRAVTMVEPRARRAAFLDACTKDYSLDAARVEQRKVQSVSGSADVISARAVGAIEKLLRDAGHCANADTIWLLPRGRSGTHEIGNGRAMFHVEHSLTDDASVILVGRGAAR